MTYMVHTIVFCFCCFAKTGACRYHHAGPGHLIDAAFVIQQLLVGLLQPLAREVGESATESATDPLDFVRTFMGNAW